eukprot:scaffold5024_cov136-Cylindrotheca_fusiformis.AAC.41
MVQIGTFLLAHVFSALLPPVDPEEDDYYEILGLEKDATNEQIRKAYKVKSLKLHPDKVAQRGNMDREEAAAQYEKVQEAYGVLVNDEKRQKYHSLKSSSTRFRFVEQGGLSNPGGLYENLTGATFMEKTRLVGLAWIIMLIILMQPILIGAKINQFLENDGALADTSWATIFVPFWIFGALGIVFWLTLLYLAPVGEMALLVVNFLEQLAWFLAIIFLVEKWDGWSASYATVLIPVYIAMVLRWIQKLMWISKIRADVARMVTMEFLEKEVLKGKSLDDLTTEEEEQLRRDYFIVTVPPDFEPLVEEGDTLDDKQLEEQKVESSPEYEAATEIYNSTLGSLYTSVIFGIIFLVLLTLKLDDKISGNWWTVFTPILIYIIGRMLYSCFIIACGPPGGELLVEIPDSDDDDEEVINIDEDEVKPDEASDSKPTAMGKGSNSAKKNDCNKNDDSGEQKEKAKESSRENEGKKKASIAKEEKNAKKEEKDNGTDVETGSSTAGEKTSSEDGPPKVGEDDSDDDINIGEETFKAWQSAYVEAEKSAMEAQAKAVSDCCVLTFQLIFVCLIIAKIEKNYDDIDPDDVGFNVFWILSPLFFVFGCIGVCCACLIYGASPGSADELNNATVENSEQVHTFEDPENSMRSNHAPIIAELPKDDVPLPNTEPVATEKSAETESREEAQEEQEDMEDLD